MKAIVILGDQKSNFLVEKGEELELFLARSVDEGTQVAHWEVRVTEDGLVLSAPGNPMRELTIPHPWKNEPVAEVTHA